MPRKKGANMRRTPKDTGFSAKQTPRPPKSRDDENNSCVCTDSFPKSVVAGSLRAASWEADAKVSFEYSVAALVKQSLNPVCTWTETDFDHVRVEGAKLVDHLLKERQKKGKFSILRHRIFGKKCEVRYGIEQVQRTGLLTEGSQLYETVQQYLLQDQMCLLKIGGVYSAVFQHGDYFVLVDCATRDASGMTCSKFGKPVAVFNTSFNDLMLHISNLIKSTGVQRFQINRISVKVIQDESDREIEYDDMAVASATVSTVHVASPQGSVIQLQDTMDCGDIDLTDHVADTTSDELCTAAVRGTFHQGDARFKHSGRQCMAVSLVALAKSTLSSVFRWTSDDLDKTVVSGDKLYNSLYDSIRHSSKFPSVSELPKEAVVEGHKFEFEYDKDCILGDLSMEEKQMKATAFTKLSDGLIKMFTQYDTCLLIVKGTSCAIVKESGQYAVVDPHARNSAGTVDGSGTSVVVYHRSLGHVQKHIENLAKSLGATQNLFEIVGVSVTHRSAPTTVIDSNACITGSKRKSSTETAKSKKFKDVLKKCTKAVTQTHSDVTVNIDLKHSAQPSTSQTLNDDASNSDVEFVSDTFTKHNAGITDSKRKSSTGTSKSKKLKKGVSNKCKKAVTQSHSDVTVNAGLKHSAQPSTSETLNDDTSNSEVEFVSDTFTKHKYSPICNEVAQGLCKKLKIDFQKPDTQVPTVDCELGSPCKNETIVGDGNCFFRAVSQAVAGTQKFHLTFRRAVVKHLKDNAEEYKNILRQQDSSVEQYLSRTKMQCVNQWATEVEIKVAADFLGVSIFTYLNARWVKYSSKNTGLTKQGIYLENSMGNHYETVVCVNQPELNNCYGYCKMDTSNSSGYNVRQRSKRSDLKDDQHSKSSGLKANKQLQKQGAATKGGESKIVFNFSPVSTENCKTLSNKYNLEFEKQDVQVHTVYGSLATVCKTETIKNDRNSFFRAFSQVVSGSQKSHIKIRRAVVKHMVKHSAEHMIYLDKKYVSVTDYVEKNKMRNVGSPATEMEIQIAANVFGVDIYVNSADKWVKYTSKTSVISDEGIYLKQSDSNHFEPVVCVIHDGKQNCFGLCKLNTLLPRQSTLKRKINDNSDVKAGIDISSSSKIILPSEFVKKKKTLLLKINYKKNIGYRQKKKAGSRKQYSDLHYKLRLRLLNFMYYKDNPKHRERINQRSISRYKDDEKHQQKTKQRSISRYKDDEKHQQKTKQRSISRYKDDEKHQQKMKQRSISRYKDDEKHQQKMKQLSMLKYRTDCLHKERKKQLSRTKYKLNALHRQILKAKNTRKYQEDSEYKKQLVANKKRKRQQMKDETKKFDIVMEKFLDKVKDGPDYVCCVCQRLLFKNQVLLCKRENYDNKSKLVASIAKQCITEEYLHKCSDDCVKPCQLTARSKLWICKTCHYKVNRGQMPPESALNNLQVYPTPEELACLNTLEQHLIALNIPFMKMRALPKGFQAGCHGPTTCVPSNIVQTTNLLPRSNMEGSLLPIKLKRKLTYKGHYDYEFVDTMHVRQALLWLKQNHKLYKDIEFNKEWINELCKDDNATPAEESDANVEGGETTIDDNEDELLHDRQQHCMFQDTCLMPVDIGQETLDQYCDSTLNLAPAEGNSPVLLLSDHTNEAKCFPVLFPQGLNTYHEDRPHRLTLSRYFNNRLLHADGRFAHNVEYIFFAQYMSEVEQVLSKVSIALRKGKVGGAFKQVTTDVLNNEDAFRNMLQSDDGYRFLRPIRGTPSFWQAAQADLMSCIRQLHIPTWFCSFSSADLRWKNLLSSILRREGRTETAEQLEWADRCNLLRRNPVCAALMFDFRWHVFLREVLMSPSNPIGKIKDYFYRVEFQQRGSPHVHCLFWVEDAPLIDKNTDEEVIEFIDKYVTCELPSEDDALSDIVTSVQQHSKRHSKTCRKKSTVCRFNFPKPPSSRTFISRKHEEVAKTCVCNVDKADGSVSCSCALGQDPNRMRKDHASDIMTAIKKALTDETMSFDSVEDLFEKLNINQITFQEAYMRLARKTDIVLKRQLDEVWVNQYSKNLLRCWNANMDIQYVVDAYACVVYIIAYISKSEREMGLLLGNAHREAQKEGNLSAKEALKKLGSVYLHNRDVCAQEAVYRLTNKHLKECSRKVVFVPTGENVVKMSLPLCVLKQRASSHDLTTQDMWMTSFVDRYKNRPEDDVFSDMCLATFASEYRIVNKNENARNKIKLRNDFGFVTKRTKTQPAVVRYARFSQTKNPELYHQSGLQLFLPYRVDDELKPAGFETFQQFSMNGRVRFGDGTTHLVRAVVDSNRRLFEIDAEELDNIQNSIDTDEMLEDAWCELCPAQELERLECEELRSEPPNHLDEDVGTMPDLAVSAQQVVRLEKRNNILCRSDGLSLVRSLNETQMSIFYRIRQWCLDLATGKKPEPFHVFITGGAGTGKTHLIKAIQYEAMRVLTPVCRHPDDISVVLTAPTGIAAYNLNAGTIHSTFSIGIDVSLPYTPLGEEKLNTLRAKHSSLKILIIDEISMVDHRLLAYIHGRLRQIKQTGDFAPFGNVSLVCVGDFFQLPPVKGKALYEENVGFDLWLSLFKVVELKTIVRQKDAVFAQLLNRLRNRSKGSPLLESDLMTLRQCETGEDSSVLHIFPTNRQVNEHNVQQLVKICADNVEIDAQDYVNSKTTGKLELKVGHHSKTYNTSLVQKLILGVTARVMLIKNVDVADGLVNGVCGTVTHIVIPTGKTFPQAVYVQFDDKLIGAQRRRQSASVAANLVDSTAILPEEERVVKKGGMRRQFPLKLAWACTVHKVQGITVDSAVVCLDKIFAAGQAYVALSRVRNLSGLVIKDFVDKAIYCKNGVEDAIQTMPLFLTEDIERHPLNPDTFNLFLMNVQGLTTHLADLTLCTQHLQLNCIAVTESWLHEESSLESVKIDGYSFHSFPRSVAYSSNSPALVALQGQQHGGVGLYSVEGSSDHVIELPQVDLECVVHHWTTLDIVLAVIYRPPSYPLGLFKDNLGKLLDWLNPKSETVVVMGDFNDDILKSSTICKFITDEGYVQCVTQATTEKGTLIDHVYVKTVSYDIESNVVPTYFSDHEGVSCHFKRRRLSE